MRTHVLVLAALLATPLAASDGNLSWWAAGANATSIAVGFQIACVRLTDGSAECEGSYPRSYTYDDVIEVAAGNGISCVLRAVGDVDCGGGTQYGTFCPACDYRGRDAVDISYADETGCLVRSNGAIVCWGRDAQTFANYAGGDARKVGVGEEHSCVLRANGNAVCLGTMTQPYAGGDGVDIVSANDASCVRTLQGAIRCWGPSAGSFEPEFEGLRATAIAAGRYHVCALLDTRDVRCASQGLLSFGFDYDGGDAIGIAAGHTAFCLLVESGDAVCANYWPTPIAFVAVDPVVAPTAGGTWTACDDWDGDGRCSSSESLVRLPPPRVEVDAAGVRACLDEDESGACDGEDPGVGVPP